MVVITKPIMLDETGKEVRDAILALSESFNGITGPAGPAGTPVTVTNVTESTEDGGSNVVTFSDGTQLTVKNGSKGNTGEAGQDGETGFSPTIDLNETDEGVEITVTNEDGQQTATVKNGSIYETVKADISVAVRMVAEFLSDGTTLEFNAHNGSMILCAAEANEATFTDRLDATQYLIPIPKNAVKVTLKTNDPQVTMAQFVGVNGSGGSYTKVFSSEREAVYSYEFEKGSAQWMAIDLIYEDTAAISVPWEYDVAATTTVTFSLSADDPRVTAVDLSNYESSGTIVETYDDGSTVTYSMEFDADGNPTKITDSNGNETVLTW